MSEVVTHLKTRLPWFGKILAKLLLSRLPVSSRVWQKLKLFSPGDMLMPDYALAVFEAHYAIAGRPEPKFTFLELGPGDSLASAVVGHVYGASRAWLVDVGTYASTDIADYRPLLDHLAREYPNADLEPLKDAETIDELLSAVNAAYLREGLASFRSIPTNSCDFLFTQGVLEHVLREDFEVTIAEMYRVLKPSAVSSHEIDFRDHLGASLHNLRFPERLWEAPWFARRSGFYTNRLRFSEMVRIFKGAGFSVEVAGVSRWNSIPLDRSSLGEKFATADEDDLLIWEARVRLSKSAEGQAAAV